MYLLVSEYVSISIDTPVLIEQHLNCSICLGLFKDPVTTPCGHTFCQSCMECNLHFNDLICPVCKKHLRRNPQANLGSTKADMQERILKRETKLEEIRVSVEQCKAHVDRERREIDSVFKAVMAAVEETQREALRPLEERQQELEREAGELNPGAVERDQRTERNHCWSTMMERIKQELEKLSSVELERILKFA
ncbi:unnamed protein product, partial [Coregonus sp. 'balchen']